MLLRLSILFLICVPITMYAQSQEASDWMELETYSSTNMENKIKLYKKFIAKYPNSENTPEAKKRVRILENEYAAHIFALANKSNDPQLINDAIKKYPNHRLAAQSRIKLRRMDHDAWAKVDQKDSLSIRKYLNEYPNGLHTKQANSLFERSWGPETPIVFAPAKNDEDIRAYSVKQLQAFLKANPDSPLNASARAILAKKEGFYYDQARAQETNIFAFRSAVNKSADLFPGTEKTAELLNILSNKEKEFALKSNRPDYMAWQNLNKTNLAEIRTFMAQNKESEFYPKCEAILNKMDDKKFTLAKTRMTLIDIDDYLKNYPNGRHVAEVNVLKSTLTSKSDFKAFSQAAESGNVAELFNFIQKNPDSDLKPTAIQAIQSVKPLTYQIRKEDDALVIDIHNFITPSVHMIADAGDVSIDSSNLKDNGEIAINFEDSYQNFKFKVKDSNGREVLIDFSKELVVKTLTDGDIIKLFIDGGTPPYTMELYNTDLDLIHKFYDVIVINPDHTFSISKDTMKDLSGNYDINVRTITAQEARLTGFFFEDRSGRTWKTILFGSLVTFAAAGVVYWYWKRSRQKTVFDEF